MFQGLFKLGQGCYKWMGFVNCQARAKTGDGGQPPRRTKQAAAVSDACSPSGRSVCLGFQIWSKFNASGPRLFLIQGLCALVSVNTEINTTLQSAPFIIKVSHRGLLPHSRRLRFRTCSTGAQSPVILKASWPVTRNY